MDVNLIKIPSVYVLYKSSWVSGRKYEIARGKWNFFVKGMNLKIPYTQGIFLDCRSRARPNRRKLASGKLLHADLGRYNFDEWTAVLFKTAKRRVVENYVTAMRLYRAGLGPAVSGIAHIRRYMVFGRNWRPVEVYGLVLDNVWDLPKKENATREQILDAGVALDRIESCLRQQENGYVIDLNSVCGVMPVDAEQEIDEINDWLLNESRKTYNRTR